MHGLNKIEKQKEEITFVCPRCDKINESDVKFCGNCGTPLDVKTAMIMEANEKKDKEDSENFKSLFRKMMQDKEFWEVFSRKAEEIGLKRQ